MRRYLDSQFYENVNSPRWRDQLRRSLGFCHEHAWLGVDERLGDALGYSILYRDLINSILGQWEEIPAPPRTSDRRASLFGQLSDLARGRLQKLLEAVTPRRSCPVCEQRDETGRTYIAVLVEEIASPAMISALESSHGLCLPHLRRALEAIKDEVGSENLLRIQRARLENLRGELEEFIRKNDYQVIQEGFGTEGDAWLRAIALVVGNRKR